MEAKLQKIVMIAIKDRNISQNTLKQNQKTKCELFYPLG